MPTINFEARPLSWSAISSFEYDKEQWARKYLDGIQDPPNQAMLFGNEIGGKIASDPKFLPDVPRYDIFEQKLTGRIGDINLIGFIDSFRKDPMALLEYKTSANKKKWTRKSAQEHGQILLYLFLLWRNYGVPPEAIKCDLVYIPVEETGSFEMKLSVAKPQVFPIRHTTVEVMQFAQYVKKVYREMQTYRDLREANRGVYAI